MKFVNTAELKNHTNEILREVRKHRPVVVTLHGHPCAALIPIDEEEFEDLLWELSPKVQKRLALAQKEIKTGKTISLKEFARKYGISR